VRQDGSSRCRAGRITKDWRPFRSNCRLRSVPSPEPCSALAPHRSQSLRGFCRPAAALRRDDARCGGGHGRQFRARPARPRSEQPASLPCRIVRRAWPTLVTLRFILGPTPWTSKTQALRFSSPISITSALGRSSLGLELGADDLAKPFNPKVVNSDAAIQLSFPGVTKSPRRYDINGPLARSSVFTDKGT